MVRHIVLFSYKPEAGREKLTLLHEKFRGLPSLIPGILELEWGKDMSVENLHHGFTDGYVLSFDDAGARDRYLVHPHHKAFTDFAAPLLKEVLVFDYIRDKIA